MAGENEDDIEPMAKEDEIEQHLIAKIEHAIESVADHHEKNPVIIKEFKDVIEILKKPDSPKAVEDWQSVRRENLYYLTNLFTEWQITKGKDPSDVLKKMKKEINGDKEGSARAGRPADQGSVNGDKEGSARGQGSVRQPPPAGQEPRHTIFKRHTGDVYRWSSRHGPRKVHGLEHIVMALERDLVMRNVDDDSFKVFGITGVPGIGKTTLCQQVFNRESVKKHFCPRIWVCLSKQPRDRKDYREEVVVRILKCLGIEDEIIGNAINGSDGLKRLILLLRLQLIGKRYLLVLDDACFEEKKDKVLDEKKDEFLLNLTQKQQMDENWGHELAYALPKGCGATIICSSRSQMLLKRMLGKEASLTVLKRQTEAIIYEIFQDNVKGYDEDERVFPQHLKDLEKEILKKCDGIPLAATLLAKIAREGLALVHPTPAVAGGSRETKQAPASDGASRLN